ncbi:unnamed protein product, partial [Cyprideis torosa]
MNTDPVTGEDWKKAIFTTFSEMFFGLMKDASFEAMSLIPNVSRLLRESHMIEYMVEERPTFAKVQVLQENSGPRGAQVEPHHLNEASDEKKDWKQDLNKLQQSFG